MGNTDNEIPALDLSELKMGLIYGDLPEAKADIVRQIIAFGPDASSLYSVLVDENRADRLERVPLSLLVKLFVQSGYADLLNALREKDALRRLSDFEKCKLLEAGVAELEPELMQSLFKDWEAPRNPSRVEIVKSLGRIGSSDAREMLSVILGQVLAKVSAETAYSAYHAVGAETDETLASIMREVESKKNSAFLDEIRSALRQMDARGVVG